MTRPPSLKMGFSWPELLFLLSIALIITSIAVPIVLEIQNYRRCAAAYSEMKVVLLATKRFNAEYRYWPSEESKTLSDIRYGEQRSNAGVINILRAIDDTGNEGHAVNPSQIDFIEFITGENSTLRFNGQGEWVDPWGSQYQIVHDLNYDNICTIPGSIHEPVVGEGVVIWSKGMDKKSDTKDDLTSW